MNNKNLFRVGCLDLGSNALKYKQYRIIKNKASLKPELETYKRIPIRLGTDVFNKGKIKKKTIKTRTKNENDKEKRKRKHK